MVKFQVETTVLHLWARFQVGLKHTHTMNFSTHQLLNDKSISFDGMDGKFSFKKNIISRKLSVLKISNGKANLVK